MFSLITDTEIFKDYENDNSNYIRAVYFLYIALCRRENYYQIYSPTAFGDTDYARVVGIICGILQATGWEEVQEDNYIVIKNKSKKVLTVSKISKPKSYYEDKKEIEQLLNEIR